jgi:hypothetical protein
LEQAVDFLDDGRGVHGGLGVGCQVSRAACQSPK